MEFRVVLQKVNPAVQIYHQSNEKNLIDLDRHEYYAQILSYLLLIVEFSSLAKTILPQL